MPFSFPRAGFVAAAGGGGGGYTPPASCVVWGNAEVANVTKDGSNLISAATDLSGSGHNFAASGGNRPLWVDNAQNGYDVADHDGSNVLQSSTFTTISGARTIAVACKLDTTGSNMSPVGANDITNETRILWESGGTIRAKMGNAFANASLAQDTNWHVFVGRWDATTQQEIRVDGSSAAVSTTNPTLTRNITLCSWGGASLSTDRWQGYIAEVLLFNAYLTGGDLTDLENYLTGKWL